MYFMVSVKKNFWYFKNVYFSPTFGFLWNTDLKLPDLGLRNILSQTVIAQWDPGGWEAGLWPLYMGAVGG